MALVAGLVAVVASQPVGLYQECTDKSCSSCEADHHAHLAGECQLFDGASFKADTSRSAGPWTVYSDTSCQVPAYLYFDEDVCGFVPNSDLGVHFGKIVPSKLEVEVGNYPCGGIATSSSNGCRDDQKCCWINQYSGWCSATGTEPCSGSWFDKNNQPPTSKVALVPSKLEVEVGNYPCGGIATSSSNGCRDDQKCCWINQYSGWCSATGTEPCSGNWFDKSNQPPTSKVALVPSLTDTSYQSCTDKSCSSCETWPLQSGYCQPFDGASFKADTSRSAGPWTVYSDTSCQVPAYLYFDEDVCGFVPNSNLGVHFGKIAPTKLEVEVGNYPCGGIATASSNGCRDDQKCCWINQYSGWCSATGTEPCSGSWFDKNNQPPTLVSV